MGRDGLQGYQFHPGGRGRSDHKSSPGSNDTSGSESEEDIPSSEVDNWQKTPMSSGKNVSCIVQMHVLDTRIFSSYCATTVTDPRVSCYSEGIYETTVQLLKPFRPLHLCTQQRHNTPSQFLMILCSRCVVSQYIL